MSFNFSFLLLFSLKQHLLRVLWAILDHVAGHGDQFGHLHRIRLRRHSPPHLRLVLVTHHPGHHQHDHRRHDGIHVLVEHLSQRCVTGEPSDGEWIPRPPPHPALPSTTLPPFLPPSPSRLVCQLLSRSALLLLCFCPARLLLLRSVIYYPFHSVFPPPTPSPHTHTMYIQETLKIGDMLILIQYNYFMYSFSLPCRPWVYPWSSVAT